MNAEVRESLAGLGRQIEFYEACRQGGCDSAAFAAMALLAFRLASAERLCANAASPDAEHAVSAVREQMPTGPYEVMPAIVVPDELRRLTE